MALLLETLSARSVRPTRSRLKRSPLFYHCSRFTDNTVWTVGVAETILTGRPHKQAVHTIGQRYPRADYGGSIRNGLYADDPQPYNSWGNGLAMRVTPVGCAFDTEEELLAEARESVAISHNHPEGIKGAQATALAVFLAQTGSAKEEIREQISARFGYNLQWAVDSIRPTYAFDVSCQGTVPEAIIAFLDAAPYEDAVRNAISLGEDSDTLACITGGIAETFYRDVPDTILGKVRTFLASDLLAITEAFRQKYIQRG